MAKRKYMQQILFSDIILFHLNPSSINLKNMPT